MAEVPPVLQGAPAEVLEVRVLASGRCLALRLRCALNFRAFRAQAYVGQRLAIQWEQIRVAYGVEVARLAPGLDGQLNDALERCVQACSSSNDPEAAPAQLALRFTHVSTMKPPSVAMGVVGVSACTHQRMAPHAHWMPMQACKFMGCRDPACSLCKNNPKKRCAQDDNFDGAPCAVVGAAAGKACLWVHLTASMWVPPPSVYAHTPPCLRPRGAEAYADNQVLRTKCEADIFVELYNVATGRAHNAPGTDVRVRRAFR